MADVVYNTVFAALLIAEAELKQKDLDQAKVKAAFDELIFLSRRVSDHHLASDRRTRHRYIVGEYYPIVQRSAERWYKTLNRRMSFRCGILHPYRVILKENFSRELFSVIRDIVARTGFGVHVEVARDVTVMAFTSRIRVKNLFCDLLGRQVEDFLVKKARGLKKVKAVVDNKKQFSILQC